MLVLTGHDKKWHGKDLFLNFRSKPQEVQPADQLKAGYDLGKYMLTLIALLSYLSSLTIIYLAASELAVLGGMGSWLKSSIFAVPFIYLLTRLHTKRDKPWSVFSGVFLSLYLFCNISVLVAWPGLFRGLPLKSATGAQAGNLMNARNSLAEYLQAGNAIPPDLSTVLPVMPALKIPLSPHKAGDEVHVSTFADIKDSGRWLYVVDASSPVILIDCAHTDFKGKPWSSY
jgi:hypothetical protein